MFGDAPQSDERHFQLQAYDLQTRRQGLLDGIGGAQESGPLRSYDGEAV